MSKYGLKNRTRFSNAIDTDLLNELKEFSQSSQIPMSRLLDNAIKMLLDSYKTTT